MTLPQPVPPGEAPAAADVLAPGGDADPAHADVRVRQAASADTHHERLNALATDPVVTVRAAVAMNRAAPPEVDALLSRDGDERVRVLLARKLARLVPGLPRAEREELQSRAYATLSVLVADEAVRVRAAIADVLKDMADAPRDLILRLAQDVAVPVCDPVIRLSPVLTPRDLLALIAATPSPGTAAAVARRPGIPAEVSDAVAAGSDARAIAALLRNPAAAVREATLDALTTRSVGHPDWHEALVRQPRLSAYAACLLSEIVTTRLLTQLAARGDLDLSVAAELRQRLAARLEQRCARVRCDPSITEAYAEARALQASGQLDEAALLAAAQRGDARLCTAMLAVAANLPVVVVDRAVTLRSAKALVSVVWRAGFSMHAAGPVQMLLGRLSPSAILRGRGRGEFPLAVEEMRWQIEFLTRSSR